MPGMLDNLTSSAKGMLFDGAGEKAILYVLNPASDLDKLSDIAKAANGLYRRRKILILCRNRRQGSSPVHKDQGSV